MKKVVFFVCALLVLALSGAPEAKKYTDEQIRKFESPHLKFTTNMVERLKRLSDQGDYASGYLYARALHRALQRGDCGMSNSQEIFSLYEQGAKHGFAPSIANLGMCYEDGIGCEKDPFKAVELYERAIKNGSYRARAFLGRCLIEGVGVARDLGRGTDLLVESADALRWCWPYRQLYCNKAYSCVGDAMVWADRATRTGDDRDWSEAMLYLGCLSVFSHVVKHEITGYSPQTRKYATRKVITEKMVYDYLSRKARDKKLEGTGVYCILCRMMGQFAENGWSCKKDPVMALRWYYRAMASGDKEAPAMASRLERSFSKETVELIRRKESGSGVVHSVSEIKKLAEAASERTFALGGFYLGMSVMDAKTLVEDYLPCANVVITANNDIEIDVVHEKEFDLQPMFFCQADASGKVRRFNFDKNLLVRWFAFDVQDATEWASAFGQNRGYNLRYHRVNKDRDLGDVWLSVAQEAYGCRDNQRKCEITYFGKKEVRDPNGPLNMELMFSNPTRYGKIAGLRGWVDNDWENGPGAREGTLRVEKVE